MSNGLLFRALLNVRTSLCQLFPKRGIDLLLSFQRCCFFLLHEMQSSLQYKKDDWEGILRRMKEIRMAIGELIRAAVRRTVTVMSPPSQTFERVICRNFLKNMISRFK